MINSAVTQTQATSQNSQKRISKILLTKTATKKWEKFAQNSTEGEKLHLHVGRQDKCMERM
jgi:hypothetical protein